MEKLLLTVLCLVLLSLNLSCINPVLSEESGTGFLNLNIGIMQPKILAKRQAIIPEDTIIQLKALYFKFGCGSDTIRDSMSMLSFNIRNNIILPIRNYPLQGLKTWWLEVKGTDIVDSVIYYKTMSFQINPADTTNVSCILESRFTIFVARIVSQSNSIQSIHKIQVELDGKEIGLQVFPHNKKRFDEYFAYKYLLVGVSHYIEFLAFSDPTTLRYSGEGNFTAIAGQDIVITFPLN